MKNLSNREKVAKVELEIRYLANKCLEDNRQIDSLVLSEKLSNWCVSLREVIIDLK